MAFIKANYSFKKIRERENEPNFKLAIGLAFAEISVYAGIKDPIQDIHKKDIIRMILMVYSDLTLEEIYKAFELERYGAYGDKTEHFQLFNADYISKVLQKYKKWRQDVKIQHNISADQKSIEPKLTPEQEKEIMDKAIIRLYEEFLVSGEISIPCTHVFDELYHRQLFSKDTNYVRKYSIAKFQLEKELKAEKSQNYQDRLKIQEFIDNLNSNNNEKVISRAKQLVLKDYFTHLKSINQSISELLA